MKDINALALDNDTEIQLLLLRKIMKAKYRNIECPCESGLKFKKCCLKKAELKYKSLKFQHSLGE
ncbi:SEC-C domain-containing protein [Vibrio harveyi]|nr:SEC-C domain-containing protein [Vibrio harveyi]